MSYAAAAGPRSSSFVDAQIASLKKYEPVQPLSALAKAEGLPVTALLKLEANENSYGCPRACVAALAAVALPPAAGEGVHLYPDPDQVELKTTLAALVPHCPPREHLVVGAGSDDILEVLIRCVDSTAPILIMPPTFGMYDTLASWASRRSSVMSRVLTQPG